MVLAWQCRNHGFRNQLRLTMYRAPGGLDRSPAKYFHGRKHTMATRPIDHWIPSRVRRTSRFASSPCLAAPAALSAQHHACGPGATQRGSYPDRAERCASLSHHRHQYAEAVSARLPRHRCSADTLQRSRTEIPQQDPRAGRSRPAPLRSPRSPDTIKRSLKDPLKISTRSVQYCMLIRYHSCDFVL